MGCYTYYTLSIHEGDLDITRALLTLEEISDYKVVNGIMHENGEAWDSVKWHEHEEEMKELSKLFPDVVFCLYGEGEEDNDLWYKYFKNGLVQRCPAIITFDEFNEDKMGD